MSRPSFGSSGSSRISSGQIRQDICKSLFERGIPKDHGNLVSFHFKQALGNATLMPGTMPDSPP